MPIDQATLWRAIGRFEAERDADRRWLDQVEEDVTEIKGQIGTITTWGTRGGLLVLLWAAAIGLNLNPEQKAEAIQAVISALTKR